MEQKKTNKTPRDQSAAKTDSDRKNEEKDRKTAQGQGKERSR